MERSLKDAKRAFKSWKRTSGKERAALMNRLADLIEENKDRMAKIETTDNGKILKETSAQMMFAARNYRFFAGYADKLYGRTIPLDDEENFLDYTKKEPLGVVVLITSWNSPISILTNKLAPALATGNAVIIKPSEHTSVSTLELAALIDEAGFPPGVVNVITGGPKVGSTLIQSPHIAKVSFTGGTETGKLIARETSYNLVRNTLELGGKSPNIVFEDADLDAAVTGALAGIFGASGQTCIAGSRLMVQASIYEDFIVKLKDAAGQIKLGNPLSPETNMGPVATEGQYVKITKSIEDAVNAGAEMILGEKDFKAQLEGLESGYFIAPTVFSNVDNESDLAQKEIFGPVLSVIQFNDDEEAISIANDSDFGLAAGIWTENVKRAHKIANELEAGTVWINTYRTTAAQAPFGGYKQSGYGRERGEEALHEYTQVKNIMLNLSDEKRDPFSIKN